eukprot:GHVU01131390.1.p1 GENE.GHVU01131390.1~~GHVU01131390.1.p1  ORF type:complete len:107 (-),score=5.04 GHVU01131390.1:206-526(-)
MHAFNASKLQHAASAARLCLPHNCLAVASSHRILHNSSIHSFIHSFWRRAMLTFSLNDATGSTQMRQTQREPASAIAPVTRRRRTLMYSCTHALFMYQRIHTAWPQ